jgi:hypothetical protein
MSCVDEIDEVLSGRSTAAYHRHFSSVSGVIEVGAAEIDRGAIHPLGCGPATGLGPA